MMRGVRSTRVSRHMKAARATVYAELLLLILLESAEKALHEDFDRAHHVASKAPQLATVLPCELSRLDRRDVLVDPRLSTVEANLDSLHRVLDRPGGVDDIRHKVACQVVRQLRRIAIPAVFPRSARSQSQAG